MSLRIQPRTAPAETARATRAAFPGDNTYLALRDELGPLFTDDNFAALYPTRGRPAEAPWRLALVTVFPFIENLSDRQAADAARARIDWQYAPGLELTDPGAVDKGHNHVIKVKFSAKGGGSCPSKANCTRSTRRTVTIRPREQYEASESARPREGAAAFEEDSGKRAGVEGTASQGVRVCGLRRARYAGQAKTRLRHQATAAALNVLRIGDRLAGKPREQTRTSAFVRLMTPLATAA